MAITMVMGLSSHASITEQKLNSSDGASGDSFGIDVAIAGNFGLVGAMFDQDNGAGSGSAYVYDLATGQELRKIKPTDGALADRFGEVLDVVHTTSGDFGVIGSVDFNSSTGQRPGAAYVFDLNTGQQLHKLTPGDLAPNGFFGSAIAATVSPSLGRNVALIGNRDDDDLGSQSGSAYLFDVNTGQELRKFTASDGDTGDRFGINVAANGNFGLIGASGDEVNGANSGSAYLVDLVTGQEIRKFLPSVGGTSARFGRAVAVTDRLSLIGSADPTNVLNGPGVVYVYDNATGNELFQLQPDVPTTGNDFGFDVGVVYTQAGEIAVVGAHGENSSQGAIYLFNLDDGSQLARIVASDAANSDLFGWSSDLVGGDLLVGAWGDDPAGSAYVYDVSSITIPTPSSAVLLLASMLGCLSVRQRRCQSKKQTPKANGGYHSSCHKHVISSLSLFSVLSVSTHTQAAIIAIDTDPVYNGTDDPWIINSSTSGFFGIDTAVFADSGSVIETSLLTAVSAPGSFATLPGTLSLTGAGTQFDAQQIAIGSRGRGSMLLTNGASATTNGQKLSLGGRLTILGSTTTYTGDLTIDDSFMQTGEVAVGDFGFGLVTIENNGSLNSTRGSLNPLGGQRADVLIDTNSLWRIDQDLVLNGEYGEFGALRSGSILVSNGGVLSVGDIDPTTLSTGSDAVTVISDSAGGTNGLLTITNGGSLNTRQLMLGINTGESATLELSGQNPFDTSLKTTLVTLQNATIGDAGNATVTVSDEALFSVGNDVTLGANGGIGDLTLQDSGTRFQVTGDLTVNLDSNFTVSNGAHVESGTSTTTTFNTDTFQTISDAGTEVDLGQTLILNGDGAGSGLLVNAGALVEADNLTLTSGEVLVLNGSRLSIGADVMGTNEVRLTLDSPGEFGRLRNTTGTGNRIMVGNAAENSESMLPAAGGLIIDGGSALLDIATDDAVQIAGDVIVARQDSGIIVVGSAFSSLSVSGNATFATELSTSTARLDILDGGVFSITGNATMGGTQGGQVDVFIDGEDPGTVNHGLNITGALNATGDVDMTIADGGRLAAFAIDLDGSTSAAGGSIELRGTGSVNQEGSSLESDDAIVLGGSGTHSTTLTARSQSEVLAGGEIRLRGNATFNILGAYVEATTLTQTSSDTINFVAGTLALSDPQTIDFDWAEGILGLPSFPDPFTIGSLREVSIGDAIDLQVPLQLGGGTLRAETIDGFDQLQLDAGKLHLTSTIRNNIGQPNPTINNILTPQLTLNPNVELEVDALVGVLSDGRLELNGGKLRSNALTAINNGGIVTGGGQVIGNVANNAVGRVSLSAGDRLRVQGSVTNEGEIEVLDAEWETTGTVNNIAATAEINGEQAIFRFNNGLNNDGVFALTAGNNRAFGDIANGAIGQIKVSGDASLTLFDDVTNSGSITADLGSNVTILGSFSGNGVAGSGDVFLAGDTRPGFSPGTMTFGGNLVLGEDHILEIELGGTDPTDFDRLFVTGDLTIDGELQVSVIDGFLPQIGDEFTFAEFGSLSDQGLNYQPLGLSGGRLLVLSSPTTLTVIPEPAGYLALGALVFGLRRRRNRYRCEATRALAVQQIVVPDHRCLTRSVLAICIASLLAIHSSAFADTFTDGRFDLSNIDGTNGFRVPGIFTDSRAGWSVASAGDINGDAIDDIIIGGLTGPRSGVLGNDAAYVIFGTTQPRSSSFDLSSLDGSNGFVVPSPTNSNVNGEPRLGASVSGAGDVNGDGIGDLIIGSPSEAQQAGSAFVVFGQTSAYPASFDLTTLNGTNGFRMNGPVAGPDFLGISVSGAGDFNDDGIDDVIVGGSSVDANGVASSGAAYLIYGKTSAFTPSFNVNTLSGVDGFELRGVNANDFAGVSVSDVGDVNGDGIDDVIVGAEGADPNGIDRAGTSYVVYGSTAAQPASISLGNLNGTNGFTFEGNISTTVSGSGQPVANAGDLNQDGYDDIVIGQAYLGSGIPIPAGNAYVVLGSANPSAVLSPTELDGNTGFVFTGDAGDLAGYSAHAAGDVNGDGYDDLILGAVAASPQSKNQAGAAYVIFGTGQSFTSQLTPSDLDGISGFVIEGEQPSDLIGYAVSGSGDFNGDQISDLLISSVNIGTNMNPLAGQVYVVYGQPIPSSSSFAILGLLSILILGRKTQHLHCHCVQRS